MKSTCICILLLAVTSSSLGSPLKQLGVWTAQQRGGHPRVDWWMRNRDRTPGKLVVNEHLGAHIIADKNDPPPPPKLFDWREKGVISPVKNQGSLGDPVAIAAEECVESLNAIKKGKLDPLSIPEVSDCCETKLVAGNIFDCIHNIGGLCSASTYPALTGHCRNGSCHAAVQIQGGKTVPPKQVMQMTESLLICPLMVFVDASETSFEMYKGGVYADPNCNPERVDHALQVVGYGEDSEGTEYWICKNSWGETWGEQGYIRIRKGDDMCGIESFATYPY